MKEKGLKPADIIALVNDQMGADDLMTGEEKAEKEAARLKAIAEAKAGEEEEESEEVEETKPEDPNDTINKLINEKFENMEINLTNHINKALKIKRKGPPESAEPSDEEKLLIEQNNRVQKNHFEVMV